jgi:peroxiredoxin
VGKRTVIRTIVVLVLLGATAYRFHQRGKFRHDVAEGQHSLAPDFALPQLDGKELKLSTYRGKVVLLDFWTTWCCRDEVPPLMSLQQQFGERGLQVIGISMDDSSDPVREFYQQLHVNYPVVMGNAEVGESYGGILGLPIAFLIDRDGHIAARHLGTMKKDVLQKEIEARLEDE